MNLEQEYDNKSKQGQTPIISICCIAYNHGKYIGKAIESFLSQETEVPFEIIIHDDASVDNTREVIRYYQHLYPQIIKPIFQEQNQYQNGKKIFYEYVFPAANGKYIAICEGDDYWISKNKIQMQYEFMENDRDCSLCFHSAEIISVSDEKVGYQMSYSKNDFITLHDVILNGGGFCPTASLFFRKKDIISLPDFYFTSKAGDYALQIYLATIGKVFYFRDIFSAYRVGDINSWTSRNTNMSDKDEIELRTREIHMLEEYNRFFDNRYTEIVNKRKIVYEVDLCILLKNYSELRNEKYRTYIKQKKISVRLKWYVIMFFPFFYTSYKRMENFNKKVK